MKKIIVLIALLVTGCAMQHKTASGVTYTVIHQNPCEVEVSIDTTRKEMEEIYHDLHQPSVSFFYRTVSKYDSKSDRSELSKLGEIRNGNLIQYKSVMLPQALP